MRRFSAKRILMRLTEPKGVFFMYCGIFIESFQFQYITFMEVVRKVEMGCAGFSWLDSRESNFSVA